MTDAAVAIRPAQRVGTSVLAGLATLCDLVLLRAWLHQDLTMLTVMALHLVLALALSGATFVMAGRSVSDALATLIVLALFGPLGGPALMLVAPGQAGLPAGRPIPAAARTPPRRDPAELLFEQIVQGRRHPLPDLPMADFLGALQSGNLARQQATVAAISRHYDPLMRPALDAALASDVPALRVQAAAVYAKLRGAYGERAKALLSGGAATDPAMARAVAGSGFVDDRTCALLMELAEQDVPPQPPVVDTRPIHPALMPVPRLKRHSCGGLA